MKLIIDIDDEEYNRFKEAEIKGYDSRQISISTILNGIVLPERHGDLIDRQELIKTAYEYREDTVSITEIKYAPTILEGTVNK